LQRRAARAGNISAGCLPQPAMHNCSRERLCMQDYTFHVHDDRYQVPTLEFVSARDDIRARELAEKRLRASEHHLAVEVFEDDALLFRVER
jgi:hypothetical protein